MKHILLLGTFLFSVFFLFGQCPTSQAEFTFTSQQQIDEFFTNYPDCTDTNFNLIISGNDITDVDGLNGLLSFNALQMQNNPLLTNINGLSSVTSFNVESSFFFVIENNPLLTSLSGLSNAVTNLPVDLILTNNDSLINFDGLQGFGPTCYDFFITGNDGLVDFSGLSGLETIETFRIENNSSLISFNGFDSLNLTGEFIFINNDAMQSFTSLNDINPACGFVVQENELLADVDGFQEEYLFSCGSSIIIENNPLLSICNTLYVCDAIPHFSLDFFIISGNSSGCNSTFEVSDACEIAPYNDSLGCYNFYSFPELTNGDTLEASNTYATSSSLAPSCNDSASRRDIWFHFRYESETTINIEVTSGYFMQLWTGDCAAPVHVPNTCVPDILQGVTLTANTDYFLQVWSNDSSSGRSSVGNFQITLNQGTLSDSEFANENFKISPNPVKDRLVLSSVEGLKDIYVYDILGKLVEVKNEFSSNKIDFSSYKFGIYMLRVNTQSSFKIFKILKE